MREKHAEQIGVAFRERPLHRIREAGRIWIRLRLRLSAKGDVVWRGVAQASIKPDAPAAKREALLRDAIREVLKRFPPKP